MRDPLYQSLLKMIADLRREFQEKVARVAKYPAGRPGVLKVRFEIVSLDTSTTATALITAYPCGISKVPGEDAYRQITVVDALSCVFEDETNESLAGRTGYAVYMSPVDGYGCQWEVDTLCCAT